MKKTVKLLVLGSALVLPMASFAEQTPAAKTTTTVAKVEQKAMSIQLNGVTKDNKAQIEKLAKDAGATSASLNSKTGVLKFSGSKFNKETFVGSLSALPSVGVKN